MNSSIGPFLIPLNHFCSLLHDCSNLHILYNQYILINHIIRTRLFVKSRMDISYGLFETTFAERSYHREKFRQAHDDLFRYLIRMTLYPF
jgi:hypothetical protein